MVKKPPSDYDSALRRIKELEARLNASQTELCELKKAHESDVGGALRVLQAQWNEKFGSLRGIDLSRFDVFSFTGYLRSRLNILSHTLGIHVVCMCLPDTCLSNG